MTDWPRDFNIDLEGKFLLVGGERGNKIEVYMIDSLTGVLSPTGNALSSKSPSNILFIEN